jgi:hypothetical protein
MIARRWIGLAAAVGVGLSTAVRAGGPNGTKELPAGFEPHREKLSGGYIDWTAGVIVAQGRGRAAGNSEQDRRMAERAAEVVAVRNALLVANDILVDADGRFQNVGEGEVRLRGVVKDQNTVSVTWAENVSPPECVAEISVPVWSAKGVASVIYERQKKKADAAGKRLQLTLDEAKASGTVLVIDARGTGLRPCLFPTIVDAKDRVLYDLKTRGSRRRLNSPLVRYAETTLSFEQLQGPEPRAEADAGVTPPACLGDDPPAARPATQPVGRPTTQSAGPPTSQPAARASRLPAVKAIRASGKNQTDIVVADHDAEQLAGSARAAALLRSGRIIVVVDSARADKREDH